MAPSLWDTATCDHRLMYSIVIHSHCFKCLWRQVAERYPPKRMRERDEVRWTEERGKGRRGGWIIGVCATMTQDKPIQKKTDTLWFFRYERVKKKIVDHYGHFLMHALLDVAQAVVLRPPLCCSLTSVKPNLGQCSESVTSILKLNRDTRCYWLLSCLHDMKSTVKN